MHPNEDMPFEHILDQSDTDSPWPFRHRRVRKRTSKAAARFMFRTAASCMTFFLSMVRDHSFGRYFFSSNGVTCLRYSSHS